MRLINTIFANGAYTAAFQHLFNSEAKSVLAQKRAAEIKRILDNNPEMKRLAISMDLAIAKNEFRGDAQHHGGNKFDAYLRVSGKQRYIDTFAYGTVDLKHITSAGAMSSPTLARVLGTGLEIAQLRSYPHSALNAQDLISNNLGASARSYSNQYGTSIGGEAARLIHHATPYSKVYSSTNKLHGRSQ